MNLEFILRKALFLDEPLYLCSNSVAMPYINESINNFLNSIKGGDDYSLIKFKELINQQGVLLEGKTDNPFLNDFMKFQLMLFRYLESFFDDYKDEFKQRFKTRTYESDLKMHYVIIKEFVLRNGNPNEEFINYIDDKIYSE